MTKRIEWRRAQWGVVGYVNGTRVFSISWGNSGDTQRPYVLDARLPGISKSKHTGEDAAREHAEAAFALCIEALGATFEGQGN